MPGTNARFGAEIRGKHPRSRSVGRSSKIQRSVTLEMCAKAKRYYKALTAIGSPVDVPNIYRGVSGCRGTDMVGVGTR
ncbi:hypothetical protein AMATHDRAFT_64395 [Amanita thiersii Skay4041]|uniref:Uncharacterized protein n=1 Tax=Amanita thiersii Skay4041 TaxID=703135 RepID=A0A2A9NE28_9AGAR|nr:hypothetical protein AMATHDRAFT_64395 [Amanita thiersii Skay4041]